MNHLDKLRHRKRSSKIFENSFLANGAYCLCFFNVLIKNKVQNLNFIYTKIALTNIREKLRKFALLFLSKIPLMKDFSKKTKN